MMQVISSDIRADEEESDENDDDATEKDPAPPRAPPRASIVSIAISTVAELSLLEIGGHGVRIHVRCDHDCGCMTM